MAVSGKILYYKQRMNLINLWLMCRIIQMYDFVSILDLVVVTYNITSWCISTRVYVITETFSRLFGWFPFSTQLAPHAALDSFSIMNLIHEIRQIL